MVSYLTFLLFSQNVSSSLLYFTRMCILRELSVCQFWMRRKTGGQRLISNRWITSHFFLWFLVQTFILKYFQGFAWDPRFVDGTERAWSSSSWRLHRLHIEPTGIWTTRQRAGSSVQITLGDTPLRDIPYKENHLYFSLAVNWILQHSQMC